MPSCNISTKFLPATCAWIVLLACTGVYFYFPCQWLFFQLDQWGYVVPLCQAVLTLYVVANFALATFMNPGIIPKAGADEAHDDDFRMPLFKNVKMNGITIRMKWCATCELYRPPRCSHCSVCNHCIEIFDHHCPWVNNCIGRRNYRFFFMFLLSLSVHMVSIFGQCVLYVLAHKETITEPGVIVTLVVMGLIGLLFVPIVGLTVFHSILVARGRTTNEQVTGKFRSGVNPFTRGCCRNCCYTLWAPSYPDLVSMTRRAKRRPYKYVSVSGLSADGAPVASDRQVKLFIDASAPSGNSGRTTNNSAVYKQLSGRMELAGDESELQMMVSSQSRDCQSSPPPRPTVTGALLVASSVSAPDGLRFQQAGAAGSGAHHAVSVTVDNSPSRYSRPPLSSASLSRQQYQTRPSDRVFSPGDATAVRRARYSAHPAPASPARRGLLPSPIYSGARRTTASGLPEYASRRGPPAGGVYLGYDEVPRAPPSESTDDAGFDSSYEISV